MINQCVLEKHVTWSTVAKGLLLTFCSSLVSQTRKLFNSLVERKEDLQLISLKLDSQRNSRYNDVA